MKVGDIVRPRESSWGFMLKEDEKDKCCHVSVVRPSKHGGWEVYVTVMGERPRIGQTYTRTVNSGWFHETWFDVDPFLTEVYREKVKRV